MILGKMIEQDELSLSDDELEEALGEMATSFNQPVEEIKKYYDENKDKLEYFKHTILEKKAIKLIIDTSKIEEVEPESEPAAGDEKREGCLQMVNPPLFNSSITQTIETS